MGWSVIFARVLLGHLPREPVVADVDLIIPMPAAAARAAGPQHGYDHARRIIQSAIDQDDIGYPMRVEPPVVIKTRRTRRMASTDNFTERQDVGADIYAALHVVDDAVVQGATIMVFDDVFTTGTSLNAVARCLREAGARRVLGLTLARQPWRQRT